MSIGSSLDLQDSPESIKFNIGSEIAANIKRAAQAGTKQWRDKGGWSLQKLTREATSRRWIIVVFAHGDVTINWNGREHSRCRHYAPYFENIAQQAVDISGTFVICPNEFASGNREFPVLGFSAEVNNDRVVLIPDPHFIKKSLRKRTRKRTNDHIPWVNRHDRLIWRGAPTGQLNDQSNWANNTRIRLSLFALDNPELVDAKLSSFSQCTPPAIAEMHEAGLSSSYMSQETQLHYKYIANIDGNSVSWGGTRWKLSEDSLMIQIEHEKNKQMTFKQWYQQCWQPDQLFLSCGLSELQETIKWARNNQDACQQIITNASTFAGNYLSEQATQLYTTEVLRSLASVQS
ncbi:MAG: hypothetical protein JKX81_07290 [Arenicella sp.]|nr:hypothetical protein [Arenicella sp.]